MKKQIVILVFLVVYLFACKKEPTPGTANTVPSFQPGNSLVISTSKDIALPRIELNPDTVYGRTGSGPMFKPLPAGFEDAITSFYLPKGFMAVFAENNDGSGESTSYVASQSPIKINFSSKLLNKVSFVRYLAINNPTKKGVAFVDSNVVKQFNTSWYYGWSINRPSFGVQNFIPMTWGRLSASMENVEYLVGRKDVNHLLSFNEPDNPGQSNIPIIDTAISRYKLMMQTGLRLGSPAVEQDEAITAGRWLPRFMDAAKNQKLRVDFICLHWYDWGNQTVNQATDSLTAVAVFNRFKAYVERAHAAYPDQKIWLTEYNCNPSRNARPELIKYFMSLSSEWMNRAPYVERYAYFQNRSDAVGINGLLTDIASYWNNLSSPIVFNSNIE
jgi:Glycosyl hydrolase catalytic core